MKIALVTGGHKGLGFGWCQILGKNGYTVLVSSRNIDDAMTASDNLKEQGIESFPLVLDVSSESSITNASEWVKESFGHLDLLINNAGINPKDYQDKEMTAKAFKIDNLDFEEMEKVYRVNSLAPLIIVKHFKHLLKKSPAPKVVNVSSWLSSITNLSFGGHYGYVSSKNLLNILNKSMALEIVKDEIISVNVNPGWVKTDMGGSRAEFTPQQAAENVFNNVISKIDITDTGKFFNYDGNIHPW